MTASEPGASVRQRYLTRGLLALTLAGLAGLGVRAMLPEAPPVRPAPVAFLILLAIELVLLDFGLSSRPGRSRVARYAMVAMPLAIALAARIYVAFSTRDVLEWDETYYMSAAVTGADGRGLYPYIVGYGPMVILGSNGYGTALYALAVMIAGPTVFALRVVSVLAGMAAVAAMYFLIRSLYGSAAAWMGAALTSTLALFVMSNSVRMDTMALAAVACGLLAFATAFNRRTDMRWHAFAGLIFGLALQAHIDTVVTALACGVPYLVDWGRRILRDRRYRPPASMLAYVAGYAGGAVVFVIFNILPDVDFFLRATARIRVDATAWYSSGTTSLVGSFLDPRILFEKEANRYALLYSVLPRAELILAIAALGALVIRRTAADRLWMTVIAGLFVATAIVLNTASPLYFIHVMPALAVPLAALFSQGAGRHPGPELKEAGFVPLLSFAVAISVLCAVNSARSPFQTVPVQARASDESLVRTIRAAANPACVVSGDGGLYVRYFTDYPFFISNRPAEVEYAMLFFAMKDETEYWQMKQPGVVFSRDALSPGLATYVEQRGLSAVSPGLWLDRQECGR